jgi:hypothetical protein
MMLPKKNFVSPVLNLIGWLLFLNVVWSTWRSVAAYAQDSMYVIATSSPVWYWSVSLISIFETFKQTAMFFAFATIVRLLFKLNVLNMKTEIKTGAINQD